MNRTLASLLLSVASLWIAAPAAAQTPTPVEGRGTIVIEALVTPPPAPVVAPPPVLAPVPAAPPFSVAPQYGIVEHGAVAEPAPRSRPSWRTVAIGSALLVGAYALNLGGTLFWSTMPGLRHSQRDPFIGWSLVPIAGPIAQLTMAPEDWMMPILAIDLLLQVAGLVTAIVGTVVRETPERSVGPTITVTPVASTELVGLAAAGTF
jgi:hypothetical protein